MLGLSPSELGNLFILAFILYGIIQSRRPLPAVLELPISNADASEPTDQDKRRIELLAKLNRERLAPAIQRRTWWRLATAISVIALVVSRVAHEKKAANDRIAESQRRSKAIQEINQNLYKGLSTGFQKLHEQKMSELDEKQRALTKGTHLEAVTEFSIRFRSLKIGMSESDAVDSILGRSYMQNLGTVETQSGNSEILEWSVPGGASIQLIFVNGHLAQKIQHGLGP
jgi:hypothetical protein